MSQRPAMMRPNSDTRMQHLRVSSHGGVETDSPRSADKNSSAGSSPSSVAASQKAGTVPGQSPDHSKPEAAHAAGTMTSLPTARSSTNEPGVGRSASDSEVPAAALSPVVMSAGKSADGSEHREGQDTGANVGMVAEHERPDADTGFRHRVSSTPSTHSHGSKDGGDRGAGPPAGSSSPLDSAQGRFDALPSSRRASIEIRSRLSTDSARTASVSDCGGLSGGAVQGVGAARKLTSEEKAELLAMEMLQDVATSCISADSARQLEYLFESLDPISDSTRQSRVVEVRA